MTNAVAIKEQKSVTVARTLEALDFEAIAGGVYDGKGKQLDGYKRIWRPDTGATLAIMKESYALVQHKEAMFSAIDALGKDGWKVDASHLEKSGARAYVQLSRIDKPIKVMGEKVGQRLMLRNTYDGSSSLTLNIGAIVVACLNGAVILGKDSFAFNHHHTGDIYEHLGNMNAKVRKIEEGFAERLIDSYRQLDAPVPTEIGKEIIRRVLGERKVEATTKYWRQGIGRNGDPTAWNLYNGVTQYLTHDWTGGWDRRERRNHSAFELIAHYVRTGALPKGRQRGGKLTMSHFCTLVILDEDQAHDVDHSVKVLMAPYDENLEGIRRRKYVVGDDLKRMKEHYKKTKLEDLAPLLREWNGHTGGIHNRKLFYWTTYNEKAKWDWYQIGGRWTGALVEGYDPNTDPENLAECALCAGTGKRSDALGVAERKKDPAYTCNGCGGKGQRVEWPTVWRKYEGDVQPVSAIKTDIIPYALITPDGEWHQRGAMGWFGMSLDEMSLDEWSAQVRKAFKKYGKGHVAVVVDCHI